MRASPLCRAPHLRRGAADAHGRGGEPGPPDARGGDPERHDAAAAAAVRSDPLREEAELGCCWRWWAEGVARPGAAASDARRVVSSLPAGKRPQTRAPRERATQGARGGVTAMGATAVGAPGKQRQGRSREAAEEEAMGMGMAAGAGEQLGVVTRCCLTDARRQAAAADDDDDL